MGGLRWLVVLGLALAALIVGALATAAHAVTTVPMCSASVSLPPSTTCAAPIELVITAQDAIYVDAAYAFDFGDGTWLGSRDEPVAVRIASHTYRAPGVYPIVIHRRLSGKAWATLSHRVRITGPAATTTTRPTGTTTTTRTTTTTTTTEDDGPPPTEETLPPTTSTTLPTTDALAPIRPTGRDGSLKVKGGTDYRFFRGKSATNTERDAVEQTLFGIYMPQVWNYLVTMPACTGSRNFARGNLSVIGQRLGTAKPYDDIGPPARTGWMVTDGGRHYSIENGIMRRVRDCSVSTAGKVACAAHPLMTTDLRDLLDLRVEGGVCVAGADFTPPTNQPYTGATRSLGIADGRKVMPTGRDLPLLHATHAAHEQVSDWRCGQGSNPGGIVLKAHLEYEAQARNEDERHFRRMKDFWGFQHPSWTAEEACQWGRIQDRFHELWMRGQERGDWGLSRPAESAHQAAHFCLNVGKGTGITFKFYGGGGDSRDVPIMTCEMYLESQYLPKPIGEPVTDVPGRDAMN